MAGSSREHHQLEAAITAAKCIEQAFKDVAGDSKGFQKVSQGSPDSESIESTRTSIDEVGGYRLKHPLHLLLPVPKPDDFAIPEEKKPTSGTDFLVGMPSIPIKHVLKEVKVKTDIADNLFN